MIVILDLYEIPILPLGDYYLVEKKSSSTKRTEIIQYLILGDAKKPVLAADCAVLGGELYSINLATADVYTPVATIAILSADTYAVDFGTRVGTIEKTDGWHFRDNNGYVSLGITRKKQEPPHPLLNVLSIAVSLHPIEEGQATMYHFWQRGTDKSIATYYADLNNLEINAIDLPQPQLSASCLL